MSSTTQSVARNRIASLLDGNSFVELGGSVTARSTDFNLDPQQAPSDGVITGYGTIDESLVYVYSQDPDVLGGTIGEMHARKIAGLYDMAMKMGAPIIGLVDCAGLRLQEGTDALAAFGTVYQKQAMASGVIPQITAVFGSCGGGMALFTGMTDFTLMEEKASLFVNTPNALAGNRSDLSDTSAAAFQSEQAGTVDFVGSDAEIFSQIRLLVGMLPANCEDEASVEPSDDLNRLCPDAAAAGGDASILLSMIADQNLVLEMKSAYAPEMVTALIRLGGQTVGVVANRSVQYDENGSKTAEYGHVLTADGCAKAAAFVRFCDAFEIPVLSVTDVSGFKADVESEKRIAAAASSLTAAFALSSVPKINLITGEAFGSAVNVMNSKATGADLTYAWPAAKIGTMPSDLAAKIMYAGESADVIREQAAAYDSTQQDAQAAARRGYVDTIIDPAETRKHLIYAFDMLYTKMEVRMDRKHSSI